MRSIDTTTVESLELEKYLGTWYEIARFPHSFEKGLVGVSATYRMRPDYFWILSRTAQMDKATYQSLLENARNRGYDLSKLIEVDQPVK